jgi:hypothetical protein
VTDWVERMEALRRRREAAGRPIGRAGLTGLIREAVKDLAELEGAGERYNPNAGFVIEADVELYPFRWWPTETVRVSSSSPTVCPCGSPVRTLKATVGARARFCAGCLEPDGSEPRATSFERAGDPLRVAALYLPGLADALDSIELPKPKTRGRSYTIEQKREAVRLYRDAVLGQTEIAEKLGVPLSTVKTWVRRYEADPFFAR